MIKLLFKKLLFASCFTTVEQLETTRFSVAIAPNTAYYIKVL